MTGLVSETVLAAPRKPFWRGLRLFVVTCLIAVAGTVVAVFILAVFNPKLVRGSTATLSLQVAGLVVYAGVALFLFARLPRLTGETPVQIGLRMPRLADIGLVIGALAIMLVADLALGAWLAHLHIKHTQVGFENFKADGFAAIVATQLTGSVGAPVAEELLFRGVLFRTLAWRMPVVVAALTSAVIFSSIHDDLTLFPILALLGFLAALLYRRTGNLVVSMLFHSLNNVVGLSLLIAKHPA